MSETALPPLRDVIARHGLRARKSYGQNFLLDLNLTRKIARAVPELKDSLIYEVGPGPGGLTRALLEEGAPRVLAVEKDARCQPALDEIVAAYPGRLRVRSADALTVREPDLLAAGGRPVQVAANLPYNIGTALLVKWLSAEAWPPWYQSLTLMFQREVAERIVARAGAKSYGRLAILAQWRCTPKILFDIPRHWPVQVAANLPSNIGTALLVKWLSAEAWPPWYQSLTLMFQREVAERIVARAGAKSYGRLAILAQWRCTPKILFDIPPQAFTPSPKVSSSLVQLLPRQEPEGNRLTAEVMGDVTRAAFGQRRKMLKSSLKSLGSEIPMILEEPRRLKRTRAANRRSTRSWLHIRAD